ncbi:exodeoxyribonuclease V subunit beta [Neiella marina]|uniref:RecBCD enzyme subunit RecB n=1 Tax=Neiella holothuriorum TaxID=2870530 RepID=A0ABS7EIJ5_9GAMM|nr:exodeoxyribonuclease V subunit beta [Neiella holothuriorum]MBW8191576.1 exodeoxyribonuclease V subunit beta [Neiella holothuriorum]
MSRQPTQAKPLEPQSLPLFGRHLIEASAGTGKTYNITRLYLRLLLERKLVVQQILVMTFTRAATEELRGRIAATLRQALAGWGTLGASDPFFDYLENALDAEEVRQRLQAALLELDEAAIYTIHGFCNRVLSQQAFESSLPFDVSMEADTSLIQQQAVQDWLRQIQRRPDDYQHLVAQGGHVPERFIAEFGGLLTNQDTIRNGYANHLLADDLVEKHRNFSNQAGDVKANLIAEQDTILSYLLDSQQDLAPQWHVLLDGLTGPLADYPTSLAGKFATFSKYRSKAAPFKPLLQALKALTATAKQLIVDEQNHQLAQSYQLVLVGIDHIRVRINDSKQQAAMLDYDDLISRLHTRLREQPTGALSQQLQQQYPVALVDEFQDTDAAQYEIFDILYPRNAGASDQAIDESDHPEQPLLLMIGDPKQAIYGFRGGDIFTYLTARKAADFHWEMDTNWRSVADMVSGYNRLFWGNALAEPTADVFGYGIHYQQIRSTPKAGACDSPLTDPQRSAAMQYVWLNSEGLEDDSTDGLQQQLAKWCALEARRLLTETTLGDQPLAPPDIAFLVRSAREASFVKQALQRQGLDAVFVSNRQRLFDSDEAQSLQVALEGIWHCQSNRQLLRALSSSLLGFGAQSLADFQSPDHEQAFEQARALVLTLRQLWQQKGIMALMLRLLQYHYQPPANAHERAATNMLHLAEILQQRSRQYKQPQQLLNWFGQQQRQPDSQDDYLLRLESDQALIRIVTQHGSKGLEYPVVFIPFANKYQDPAKAGAKFQQVFRYQDPAAQKQVCQLGKSDEAVECVRREGHAEAIRLLYVAVTRAAHRCYIGAAPFRNSESSALGQVLHMAKGKDWQQTITDVVATSAGASSLLSGNEPPQAKHQLAVTDEPLQLNAAHFTGELRHDWQLTSFSAITRLAHQVKLDQKERIDQVTELESDVVPAPVTELRYTLKKGAAAGNLLHDICEHIDFADPQWDSALEAPVQRFGYLEEQDVCELKTWLSEVFAAPMPNMFDSDQPFCMADLSRAQTLRESEFYFPIAALKRTQLAACLQQHRGDGQPVSLPGEHQLNGMMHGFIDLIFEHQGRYYVADYKSTHLGTQPDDYQYKQLKANNQTHHYDLQYLIYCLALHRYLAVRIPDYDPASHFGGAYYLYLRGMHQQSIEGTDYPGVYYSAISVDLLNQLDAMFSGNHSPKVTNDLVAERS